MLLPIIKEIHFYILKICSNCSFAQLSVMKSDSKETYAVLELEVFLVGGLLDLCLGLHVCFFLQIKEIDTFLQYLK